MRGLVLLVLLVGCSSVPLPPERSSVTVRWVNGYAHAQVSAPLGARVSGHSWLERSVPECGGEGPAVLGARSKWVLEGAEFRTLERLEAGDALLWSFGVHDLEGGRLERLWGYDCAC